MIHFDRLTTSRRAGPTRPPAAPGPVARVTEEGLWADGRLVGGFELAPVNLELMAEVEREAALEALAAFYDAIPRSFQLLSVPADRNAGEHLAAMEERADGRRIGRALAAYAALYREIAAAPRRPLRRTYLLLDAASEPELRRVVTSLARVAEERGVIARELDADDVAALWSIVGRLGSDQRVGASVITGDGLLTAVSYGRRWPAEVEPGWLTGLLAVDGVSAVAMRVRPLSRAEAMSFMTVRLRQVRAADRLASERGDLVDVERERVGTTAMAARRAVQAGQGRIYLVDTVGLLEADDAPSLHERAESLRLEGRGLGLDLDVATLRLTDAWRAALPGPAPRRSPSGTSIRRALPRGVSVANEKADLRALVGEAHHEVPRLLGDEGGVRVGRCDRDVHAPCPDLDEEQDVERLPETPSPR